MPKHPEQLTTHTVKSSLDGSHIVPSVGEDGKMGGHLDNCLLWLGRAGTGGRFLFVRVSLRRGAPWRCAALWFAAAQRPSAFHRYWTEMKPTYTPFREGAFPFPEGLRPRPFCSVNHHQKGQTDHV